MTKADKMHLVIGAGEVGKAVANVLSHNGNVTLRDIHDEELPYDFEYMHVAFPYGEHFANAVKRYQNLHSPKLTVIHSTVPVGTSDSLGAIHSPVRGRHPHLEEGLRTFTKWFGGEHATDAALAWHALVGSPISITPNSGDTEAGKLWELLMFGLAVAQQKEMYAWCEERGVNPEIAYKEFTETYNEGYRKLDQPEVARPIIKPMPGKIGGHCVIENAPMIDNSFAELLVELNDRW